MTPGFLAWLTLIGTALSFAGVLVAIAQIRRTATAANSAFAAARETRAALAANVLLSNLAGCVKGIEEVKVHIRQKSTEGALLRLTDTRAQIVELKSVLWDEPRREAVLEITTQLAVLRDVLEDVLQNGEGQLDRLQALSTLSEVADRLTDLLGRAKFQSSGDQK